MTRNAKYLGKIRLEDVHLSTVPSTIHRGRIEPLYNVLASRTTHVVVCVDFRREWRDLQFN